MTTIDAAAAWRVRKRITLAALATGLALSLAGCGTGASIGDNASTEPNLVGPSSAPAATSGTKIAVAPVIGAPEAVAKQLQSQVAGAMEKQRVAVTQNPSDKVDYTLRGYIVAAREKTGITSHRATNSIESDSDRTGSRVCNCAP